MDIASLVQVLEKTISPDKTELETAQRFLEHGLQTNPPEFLKALSDVLANPHNNSVARMAAGLQIKNALTSKDQTTKDQYQQRWLAFPEEAKTYIKNNIVNSLGTESSRPSSAAQCVAFIALIELPLGSWTDVISVLCSNIYSETSTDSIQEASLEALGYICQDIDYECIISHSNNVLTAIVHGMRKSSTNQLVGRAAVTALFNSLEFTKANFEKEMERNYLMEVVCETTQSKDTQVRVTALQCLVKIMTLYYEFMDAYMGQALFPITMEAMKSEVDEIALQGIEFWSTVCDEEINLAIADSEAEEAGQPTQSTSYSRHYAKGALQYLVPILMQKLTQQLDILQEAARAKEFKWSKVKAEAFQRAKNLLADDTKLAFFDPSLRTIIMADTSPVGLGAVLLQEKNKEEFDDEDEWVASKAASVCLSLLVTCCNKDVLPHVLPFVKDNIKNPDWRFRDAALLAFGSILRGLDSSLLTPVIEPAMPTIIELMYDSSVAVRDTAAWIVGQICEHAPESAINEVYLKSLLEAMVQGLKSEPRVAANVCWAFVELAKASYDAACKQSNIPNTYCLSQYFELLVDKLLETTTRADGSRAKLRLAAYEALMEIIKNSPADCYTTVQKTTLIVLERLNQVLVIGGQIQNHTERGEMTDLQSLLCATLQSVLCKVTQEDAPKISDQIMGALLQMFMSNSNQSGDVHEEAMRAVTTLIEVLGSGFVKYMDSFKPFLLAGLKNHAEYQVCLAAVGVVADLCRELKAAILPYCDEIMTLLLQNLSDNSVHRSVKPQIISVLGDIALAIGPAYEKYLEVVLGILVQASGIDVDRNDYDMIDYLNDLRESILNAYSGIIQGMVSDNNTVSPLEAHIPFISSFVSLVALDGYNNDDVICACVALIGDLCTVFGKKVVGKLDLQPVNKLLVQARKSSVSKTKNYGFWVTKELAKLTPASW